jgi:hypothetical protein
MSEQFSYVVSTALCRERVWSLFANIENWTKFSSVYDSLRWSGFPWTYGSCLLGTIQYPRILAVRYALETCKPGRVVRYVAHTKDAGFASHRTIRFEDRLHGGTSIEVDFYTFGQPTFMIAGGSYGFVRMLTERWFYDFACFCDEHAEAEGAALDVKNMNLARHGR